MTHPAEAQRVLDAGAVVTYGTSSGLGGNDLTVEVLAYVPAGRRLAPHYGPGGRKVPKGVSLCSNVDRYAVRVLKKNGRLVPDALKFPAASTLDKAAEAASETS